MASIVPTIGRVVIYVLSADDEEKINRLRADANREMVNHIANHSGVMLHVGNDAREGDEYPALVVKTWGGQADSDINLKVMLDGSDTFWATSRKVGEGPGTYHWMEYQKGQAAKTEVLADRVPVEIVGLRADIDALHARIIAIECAKPADLAAPSADDLAKLAAMSEADTTDPLKAEIDPGAAA